MNTYLLFKSLHLIAVISWMAGLLYLPRIFVYHSENDNEIITSVFKTMEKKLFYYIMTPAMILSWFFGLILIHEIGFNQLANLCLQLKLLFVILLTIYHFYLGSLLTKFFQRSWTVSRTARFEASRPNYSSHSSWIRLPSSSAIPEAIDIQSNIRFTLLF